MEPGKDLHELVGLAKLLERMGIITKHQATMAMNISWTKWDRNGWPEEEAGAAEKEADDGKGTD